MTKNIYLLGFMGSGKTTVGQGLAKALDYAWEDLDKIIAIRNERSVRDIFQTYGEAFFRKEEASVLRNTALENKKVISCGGGTPCFHHNMRWINEHGLSIFLNVAPEILYQRLRKGKEARPLLQGKSPEELMQFIRNKLAERRDYYEQAHIVIEQLEEDLDVIPVIMDRLNKYWKI